MGNKIFLFILDAVRKDHLSLYGYKRKTSPNIDKLAQQADIYNWAFAPAPYTLASVPSILAGKYPVELSNRFTGRKFDWKDFKTLRLLKEKGYITAMFTANIVTSSHFTNLNEFFDYFWDDLTEKEINREDVLYQKADVVLEAVESFVSKNKKEKLFVVIHLMEAHGPYTPNIESIFKGDEIYKSDSRRITRVVSNMMENVTPKLLSRNKIVPEYQLLNVVRGPNGEIEDFERNVREYIAKYDMGIHLLDKNLGEFFNYLEKRGLFEKSKIIITSDHGEFLGEENIFFSHGIMCHPAIINVPLIIKSFRQKRKEELNNNYSLTQLLQDEVLERNRSINSGLVFSYHPKSASIIKGDLYLLVHNTASYSLESRMYEDLFPTQHKEVDEIFKNFSELRHMIQVKFYKKDSKKGFLETFVLSGKLFESLIGVFLENIVKPLSLIYRDRVSSVEYYRKAVERNKALKEEVRELEEEVESLEKELSSLLSSPFYKIWQTYCSLMKFLRIKKNE
ncbi:sulfatase-like hydrolase/transferase [Persephonella sp.]